MTLFLTPTDLQDLTGFKRPTAQRRWLTRNGYRFDVRGDGRPAVLVEEVRSKVGRGTRTSGPDLSALERLG